jgi:hypothetical protein
MSKYIEQLNPDGTPKAGVKLTGGKPQKVSFGKNRNENINVEATIGDSTPEQFKAWLEFDAGGKQGAAITFKTDPSNPNIIYFSDSHTSKSKESGGVNDFIAIDFKTNDVYTLISDKHDLFGDLEPIGGSSRLTISPITKRNLKDPKLKGTHEQRNFQDEAQAALAMLEKYKLDLPEGGLTMSTYDPVTGLIPTGKKTVSLLGESKVTIDTLKKVANAKKVENVNGTWKIDGEAVSKGLLEGAVHVNQTALAHFAGKATSKDYTALARRLGKVYVSPLIGESAPLEREGSVLGGLKKGIERAGGSTTATVTPEFLMTLRANVAATGARV